MPTKSQLAALLLAMSAPLAQANVVTSSDADCFVPASPTTRVFILSAKNVVQCLYTGMGNINGSVQPGEAEAPYHADYLMLEDGWTHVTGSGWLTGTPNNLTGGLSGSFKIAAQAYDSFESFAIGFKTGVGALDPDFAIFELAPGTVKGMWTVTGQQSLSHAILWGRNPLQSVVTPTVVDPQGQPGGTGAGNGADPNRVPEPATLALVGLGLVGAAAARRRRGSRQA